MDHKGGQASDQENDDIYVAHAYKGRMESDGIKSLKWISNGAAENVNKYYYDENAHNAIDIVKLAWAYEQ